MPRALSRPVLLLAAALACAAPVAAQAPGASAVDAATADPATAATGVTADPAIIYRREVFAYDRRGRPDPFRPLITVGELGIRLEDLQLRGIVFNTNRRQSVAVFTHADTAQSLRLREGQRFGNVTVAAIHPRRVDVRVDEFGTARMESITLTRPTAGVYPGPGSQPSGAPAEGTAPAPSTAEPAPRATQPLQRVQARNRQQAREQAQQQPPRSRQTPQSPPADRP